MFQIPAVIKVHDSNKNLRVTINGVISPGDDRAEIFEVIFRLSDLKDNPKGVRLDSIVWLIEEKAGLRLCWGDQTVLPLESRNHLRLDYPLDCPRDNWSGEVILRCPKTEASPKAFFLHLEFDKQ